jgi:hypothetical protein
MLENTSRTLATTNAGTPDKSATTRGKIGFFGSLQVSNLIPTALFHNVETVWLHAIELRVVLRRVRRDKDESRLHVVEEVEAETASTTW